MPIYGSHWMRGMGHPRQVASPSLGHTGHTNMHTHRVIPKGDIERPVNLIVLFSDVFGLWQDTSVPVEKPRMHKEDM